MADSISNTSYPQLDGIFVLNKPSGPSSAQCLTTFKKLGQKKIGHAGTLDPMASGVLLVLLGQATKLSPYLLAGGRKIYSGTLRLGIETATWDMEGEIVRESPVNIEATELRAAIAGWKGQSQQIVPPYSAAKHNGQPLYKLARKGMKTPEKVKNIHISESELLAYDPPFARFRVSCSSGSYIRSLAHSLGKRLGCGAALSSLEREYSHPYGMADACDLHDVREDPEILVKRLLPVSTALPTWPVLELDERQARDIRNGKTVPFAACRSVNAQNAILAHSGSPIALAELKDGASGSCWSILRGLWR